MRSCGCGVSIEELEHCGGSADRYLMVAGSVSGAFNQVADVFIAAWDADEPGEADGDSVAVDADFAAVGPEGGARTVVAGWPRVVPRSAAMRTPSSRLRPMRTVTGGSTTSGVGAFMVRMCAVSDRARG